jgi:hypothetical protein
MKSSRLETAKVELDVVIWILYVMRREKEDTAHEFR